MSAYLKLAQIGPELLETFLQGNEAGGYFGGSGISCLHHSLLVEECLEPKFELCMSKCRVVRIPRQRRTSASFCR